MQRQWQNVWYEQENNDKECLEGSVANLLAHMGSPEPAEELINVLVSVANEQERIKDFVSNMTELLERDAPEVEEMATLCDMGFAFRQRTMRAHRNSAPLIWTEQDERRKGL